VAKPDNSLDAAEVNVSLYVREHKFCLISVTVPHPGHSYLLLWWHRSFLWF